MLLWGAWAVFAIKHARKIMNEELKHLFEPKVNLYAKNNSASRYDGIELRRWEIYLGAVFLLPIRIVVGGITFMSGVLSMYIVYMAFGSKEISRLPISNTT